MGIYDRDYYQGDDAFRSSRLWDNRSMVEIIIIANAFFLVADWLLPGGPGAVSSAMALHTENIFQPLQWYRFVSAGFAHADMWHLISNMIGLYFLGRRVEDRYGKWEFARIYLATLVFANVTFAAVHTAFGDSSSCVGASGAVTGIVLLFVLNFPQATLLVWGVLPVKAWLVGTLLILGDVLGTQGRGNVAHDVHLYGAAFAAAYFLWGWNFSSVGSVFAGLRTSVKQKQRGLKVHAPPSGPSSRDEAESDRILEKISREGKDSLTRRERAFLEKYSEQVRKQRSGG